MTITVDQAIKVVMDMAMETHVPEWGTDPDHSAYTEAMDRIDTLMDVVKAFKAIQEKGGSGNEI